MPESNLWLHGCETILKKVQTVITIKIFHTLRSRLFLNVQFTIFLMGRGRNRMMLWYINMFHLMTNWNLLYTTGSKVKRLKNWIEYLKMYSATWCPCLKKVIQEIEKRLKEIDWLVLGNWRSLEVEPYDQIQCTAILRVLLFRGRGITHLQGIKLAYFKSNFLECHRDDFGNNAADE